MKHTSEVKKILSEKRKKWLKENPDKHPWKNKSRFKSIPCEKFKFFLNQKNVKFIEEFRVLEERYFSLDIAFPEKMVALEINGNQHYKPDGKLKPYYQERHDLIEAAGWKVIEIHFSLCYNEEYIENLIKTICEIPAVNDFDYEVWKNGGSIGIRNRNNSLEENCDIQFHYRPLEKFQYKVFFDKNKKNKWHCASCNIKISRYSEHCRSCAAKRQPKKQLPEKDELQRLILENPMRDLAPKFGLTDNGLRKRCKQLGLAIPSKSYRRRKYVEGQKRF